MTAAERLEQWFGVLDDILPYWFRRATAPLAYVCGFVAGLIDIFMERGRA